MSNPNRISVTVPADGVFSDPIETGGRAIYVESGSQTDPAHVPTIHISDASGDGVPAYPQTVAEIECGRFDRFYIQGHGDSAGTTLYLTIISESDLSLYIPDTPTHP